MARSIFLLASSQGHSQILSRRRREKIGRRPGIIATSQAGNGGCKWWTQLVLTESTIFVPWYSNDSRTSPDFLHGSKIKSWEWPGNEANQPLLQPIKWLALYSWKYFKTKFDVCRYSYLQNAQGVFVLHTHEVSCTATSQPSNICCNSRVIKKVIDVKYKILSNTQAGVLSWCAGKSCLSWAAADDKDSYSKQYCSLHGEEACRKIAPNCQLKLVPLCSVDSCSRIYIVSPEWCNTDEETPVSKLCNKKSQLGHMMDMNNISNASPDHQ